jgi:hypothetical protein
MKIWSVLIAICLCGISFALPIQDRKIDPAALSRLGSALNIPEDADIIAETQKRWLRSPGQERWELAELSPEQKLFVLDWAESQGLFAPWKPACEKYETVLILGATTSHMQMRLDYLRELWEQGIRFREIVWLLGERPLDRRVDGLTDRCHNESEAAHILWEETHLPEGMRNLPVTFISVPMKTEGGSLKRPNTEDTVIAWLKTNPSPSTTLFVSDQPFCGYQFAVIKTCLPKSFQFDLAGKGVDATSHPAAAAITLDSIARWIYQENLYQAQRSSVIQ